MKLRSQKDAAKRIFQERNNSIYKLKFQNEPFGKSKIERTNLRGKAIG